MSLPVSLKARPARRPFLTFIAILPLFGALPSAAIADRGHRPAPPANLVASATPRAVALDWAAGRPHVAYFEVYRRLAGEKWRKPYRRVRRSEFVDRKVHRGRTYEYRVRLRTDNGARSNPGPTVSVELAAVASAPTTKPDRGKGKPTKSPEPTPTPTPTPESVPTPSPTPTPTPTPTPAPSPTPTPAPSPTPTPAPAPAPTPTPTPAPSPTPAPAPSPTPTGDLGPARTYERNCAGATTSISAANDTRYIDCPGLSIPENAQRITVVGTKLPTSQLKGVKDIYIGGRPGQLMNAGPRSDGHDLLQIKRWPISTGTIPDGITLRWIRFHDVTRPGSEHPDGIQIMAGRNGKILDSVFERVDVQPIFFRYAGEAAGGGPIENWTIERTRVEKAPNGYYAIRIAGNGDAFVPRNITLRDLTLTGNVSIDRSAFTLGFLATGLTGGTYVING